MAHMISLHPKWLEYLKCWTGVLPPDEIAFYWVTAMDFISSMVAVHGPQMTLEIILHVSCIHNVKADIHTQAYLHALNRVTSSLIY